MDRRRMASAAAVMTAHLGANTTELRQDVNRVARVGRADGLSQDAAELVSTHAIATRYVTLQRFQQQADHNRPQAPGAPPGRSMAQAWGRGVAGTGPQMPMLRQPREAAMHTAGANQSRFVSLTNNPTRAHNTTDPGVAGITRGAAELHTYRVPRQLVRDPNRLSRDIGLSRRTAVSRGTLPPAGYSLHDAGYRPGDAGLQDWLAGVPSQEGEVLYMGNDLARYRVRAQVNPYREET